MLHTDHAADDPHRRFGRVVDLGLVGRVGGLGHEGYGGAGGVHPLHGGDDARLELFNRLLRIPFRLRKQNGKNAVRFQTPARRDFP